MNREKRAPLGTCDLCGGPIPPGEWYTCKGKPRLHCSLECRQTDNSRTGAPVRSAKAKQRVADGTWVNPFDRMTPDEMFAHQSKAARTTRTREVAEGRWRNPGLTPAARAINSRPEKHGNNPTLHHAIELMGRGVKLSEMPQAERAAYNARQRELYAQNRAAKRAAWNAAYKRRQAALTPEQRAAQRAKWREGNRRKAVRKSAQKRALLDTAWTFIE